MPELRTGPRPHAVGRGGETDLTDSIFEKKRLKNRQIAAIMQGPAGRQGVGPAGPGVVQPKQIIDNFLNYYAYTVSIDTVLNFIN